MAKAKKDGDLNKKKSQNKISQNSASKSQVKEKEKSEEIPKESILQSQEILIGNEEETSQSLLSGMVMNIKVIEAKNIKGSKGDKVSSFVRVQFSDFDYKDSPVVANDPQPAYNFSTDIEFEANELIIDTFLNKNLNLTLFEQLPKEKNSILGTAEMSLSDLVYKSLDYKNDVFNESGDSEEKLVIVGCQDTNGNADTQVPTNNTNTTTDNAKKPNEDTEKINIINEIDMNDTPLLMKRKTNDISSYLTITKTIPINYLNPRLLPTPKGDEDPQKMLPEFTVEVTISNFLIDPEVIEHGNFINLHLNEIYPVPEEWSLKEGTEKDLNSSKNIKKIFFILFIIYLSINFNIYIYIYI